MSIASLNQFQNEVMQDSALQEQFKTAAATSAESLGELAVKLGAERGYSFTTSEVEQALAAQNAASEAGELSDEDLEAVAGGFLPIVPLLVKLFTKLKPNSKSEKAANDERFALAA